MFDILYFLAELWPFFMKASTKCKINLVDLIWYLLNIYRILLVLDKRFWKFCWHFVQMIGGLKYEDFSQKYQLQPICSQTTVLIVIISYTYTWLIFFKLKEILVGYQLLLFKLIFQLYHKERCVKIYFPKDSFSNLTKKRKKQLKSILNTTYNFIKDHQFVN